MKKNGQLFSIDFIFSLSIFLTILFMMIQTWHRLNNEITQYEMYTEIESKILIVSNLLVKTSGYPDNWETINLPNDADKIISLGLAEKENVLSAKKILKFLDLNYNVSKTILGIPRYDFCIEITNRTGDVITLNGKEIKCNLPKPDISNVYSIKRLSVLKDEDSRKIVFFNMVLWRSL